MIPIIGIIPTKKSECDKVFLKMLSDPKSPCPGDMSLGHAFTSWKI